MDQLGRTRDDAGQWETTEPGLGELSSSLSFPYGRAARELMFIKQGLFVCCFFFDINIFLLKYLFDCTGSYLVAACGI